jgi:hypothetical protein
MSAPVGVQQNRGHQVVSQLELDVRRCEWAQRAVKAEEGEPKSILGRNGLAEGVAVSACECWPMSGIVECIEGRAGRVRVSESAITCNGV